MLTLKKKTVIGEVLEFFSPFSLFWETVTYLTESHHYDIVIIIIIIIIIIIFIRSDNTINEEQTKSK